MSSKYKGFTVLELLIVIGILAILAVAIILVLRPVEFLRQSRDAKRLNDIGVINSAINLTLVTSNGEVDWDGPILSNTCYGESNQKVYVSVPHDNGETAPTLPSGWSWAQVSSTHLYRIDGTGWIPVNFGVGGAGLGAKFPVLPIDPINTFASGQYFTYVCDPELNTSLESEKMKPYLLSDGGDDINAYEIGNKLYITPTSNLNSGNLIIDNSFEGWLDWGTEEVVDITTGYSGATSLHMFDSAVTTRRVYQEVFVSESQNYDLSYAIKTKNLGSSQTHIHIEWLNSGGGIISTYDHTATHSLTGTLSWQVLQSTATSPSGAVKARVNLILSPVTDGVPSNDAEVWFDSVSFE